MPHTWRINALGREVAGLKKEVAALKLQLEERPEGFIGYSSASDTRELEKVILTNNANYFKSCVDNGAVILFHPDMARQIGLNQSGLDQVYLFGIPRGISAYQDHPASQIQPQDSASVSC